MTTALLILAAVAILIGLVVLSAIQDMGDPHQ